MPESMPQKNLQCRKNRCYANKFKVCSVGIGQCKQCILTSIPITRAVQDVHGLRLCNAFDCNCLSVCLSVCLSCSRSNFWIPWPTTFIFRSRVQQNIYVKTVIKVIRSRLMSYKHDYIHAHRSSAFNWKRILFLITSPGLVFCYWRDSVCIHSIQICLLSSSLAMNNLFCIRFSSTNLITFPCPARLLSSFHSSFSHSL